MRTLRLRERQLLVLDGDRGVGASIASTRRTSSCGEGVSLMLTGRMSYGAAPTRDDAMAAFAAEYEG